MLDAASRGRGLTRPDRCHRALRADREREVRRRGARSRERDRRRGRLGRRDAGLRGLPILTNRSPQPERLVGDLAARRTSRRSASTRRSRTRRSTRSSRPGARRSSWAGPGSTSARRSPSCGCRRRRRRARASAGSGRYDDAGPEAAHALLAELDPAAAARVHPNDRRRVVRALELAEAGRSLAPRRGALCGRRHAAPDARCRARRAARRARAPDRGADARAMFERRRRGRGARALAAGRSRARREKMIGLREVADAAARAGGRAADRSAPGATRPTSGSGCGGSRASLSSRPTARRARSPMRSSRWHAHGNVYLVSEGTD